MWQCATCTLLNELSLDRCICCETLRPKQQDETTAASNSPPQAVLSLSQASTLPPAAATVAASVAPPASVALAAPVANVRAGLSPEERRMRDEEMRLKRRKKEDEQLRIRQQFEDDRDSRRAPAAAAPISAVPPVLAAQSTSSTQATAAHATTARLQIRCPSLNRTVTCTAFSPESTLGEVRAFLRAELLQGLQGAGADARLGFDEELPEVRALSQEQRAARDARDQFRQQTERLLQQAAEVRQSVVPSVELIALRLTLPPRTRFATPEDMALTLRAAGLCPSATLVMESLEGASGVGPAAAPSAAPLVAAADAAGREPHVEPTAPAVNESDDDVEDEDSDDEERGPLGQAPFPGSGMDGRGGGFGMQGMSQRQYGGTPGANWRFGNREMPRRPNDPFVGPNGELVDPKQAGGGTIGVAAQPQMSGGTPASGEVSAQDRRAAALAALERRNAAPAPVVTAAGASQPSVATPAANVVRAPNQAALSQASSMAPGGTKKQKDAEQKAIMAQIAAERAEFQEMRGKPPTTATSPVAAATPVAAPASSEEMAEKRQAREARLRALEQRQEVAPPPAVASTAPSAAPAAPVAAPATESQDAGQIGMKRSKKQREEEKARILQEMNEDRSTYRDLHGQGGGSGPGQSTTSSAPPAGTSSLATAQQPAQRRLVGAGSTSDSVRLCVRCAESGRSITTTAFAPSALLEDVRAFAASELRGLDEDAAKQLDIAAPFARTVFSASSDNMRKTLADLSLCPSATLVLQKPGSGQAGADAPRAPVEPEPVAVVEEQSPEEIARKQEARQRQAAAVAARLTGGVGQAASSNVETLPAQFFEIPDSASANASTTVGSETCSLRLRMPDGAVRRLHLARDLPALAIIEQVLMDLAASADANHDIGEWVLLVPFPRRVLSGEDLALSLEVLDLWPQGTLVVQHRSQQGQVRRGGSSEARQQQGAMREDEFRAWMDAMDWSEQQGERSLKTDREMEAMTAKLRSFAFEEASSHAEAAAPSATGSADNRTDRAVCAICCSEYVVGDELSALPCTHVFHKECLHRWLRRSSECCLCKASLL